MRRVFLGAATALVFFYFFALNASAQSELAYYEEPPYLRMVLTNESGEAVTYLKQPYQYNYLLGRAADWMVERTETGELWQTIYYDEGEDYLYQIGKYFWWGGYPQTITYYQGDEIRLVDGAQPYDGTELLDDWVYYNPYWYYYYWWIPTPYHGYSRTTLVDHLSRYTIPATADCPAVIFEDVTVVDSVRQHCPATPWYSDPNFCSETNDYLSRTWRAKGFGVVREQTSSPGNPQRSFQLEKLCQEDGSGCFCAPEMSLDIVYDQPPHSEPTMTSLDVYRPVGGKNLPVVVLAHGGGWKVGDKRELWNVPTFVDFFQQEGLVLVSINYRLIDDSRSPNTEYTDQATDLAKAVRWVYDNISQYGGDREEIYLLGHSAGAHLVSLVGTDRRYLTAEGLDLDVLRGVIPMDVIAYDIPFAIENAVTYGYPSAQRNLPTVFGSDPLVWQQASTIQYIEKNQQYPPFLVLWAPEKSGVTQELSKVESEMLVEELRSVGSQATVVGATEDSHGSMIANFGVSGHTPTEHVRDFIRNKGQDYHKLLVAREISEHVASIVEARGTHSAKAIGLIAVAVTPEFSIVEGYGETAVGSGEKPDENSFFHLASVSKVFTGVMLAQAVVDGTVLLDAAANEYLKPSLSTPEYNGTYLSLRQLISHYSGLGAPNNLADRDLNGSIDPGVSMFSPATGYSRADFQNYLDGSPFIRPPDQRYQYSNSGVALAAAALQDVLGNRSYQRLFEDMLSTPLDLVDTGVADGMAHRTPGRAVMGNHFNDWTRDELDYPQGGVMAGSGYLLTTGSDLAVFLRAAAGIDHSEMNAAFEEAFKSLGSINGERDVGYAIDIVRQAGQLRYAKLGSNMGYSAYILFSRKNKMAVGLMANNGSSAMQTNLRETAEALLALLEIPNN